MSGRLRLTLAEMRAANNALAFLLAGEFDESAGPNPGFTREQADNAQNKLALRIAELEAAGCPPHLYGGP